MTTNFGKASPSDFASKAELAGPRGGDGIYAMTDGVEPEDFDGWLYRVDWLGSALLARRCFGGRW